MTKNDFTIEFKTGLELYQEQQIQKSREDYEKSKIKLERLQYTKSSVSEKRNLLKQMYDSLIYQYGSLDKRDVFFKVILDVSEIGYSKYMTKKLLFESFVN